MSTISETVLRPVVLMDTEAQVSISAIDRMMLLEVLMIQYNRRLVSFLYVK